MLCDGANVPVMVRPSIHRHYTLKLSEVQKSAWSFSHGSGRSCRAPGIDILRAHCWVGPCLGLPSVCHFPELCLFQWAAFIQIHLDTVLHQSFKKLFQNLHMLLMCVQVYQHIMALCNLPSNPLTMASIILWKLSSPMGKVTHWNCPCPGTVKAV